MSAFLSKVPELNHAAHLQRTVFLAVAIRLHKQDAPDESTNKVFALLAPDVSWIGEGNQHIELSYKVSVTVSHLAGLLLGARSFLDYRYDGCTKVEQLEQNRNLLLDIETNPITATVDLGYRGVDHATPCIEIIHHARHQPLASQKRRWLKR